MNWFAISILLLFGHSSWSMDDKDVFLFSHADVRECLNHIKQKAHRSDNRIRSFEVAVWITLDDASKVECIDWPNGEEESAQWTGPIPANTVASIHSHPTGRQKGMSENDIQVAERLSIPFYAIHSRGKWIFKADPDGDNGRIGKKVGPGSVSDLLKLFEN